MILLFPDYLESLDIILSRNYGLRLEDSSMSFDDIKKSCSAGVDLYQLAERISSKVNFNQNPKKTCDKVNFTELFSILKDK